MTKIKNMLKKGFTLTELAIVIAVIAILVAVLVPTFISLIDNANESKDTQMIYNINLALSAETDIETPEDALDIAAETGYNIDKLTPSSDGDIVYDEVTKTFALISEGSVVYPTSNSSLADRLNESTTWYFASSQEDITILTASYIITGTWNSDVEYAGTGSLDTSRATINACVAVGAGLTSTASQQNNVAASASKKITSNKIATADNQNSDTTTVILNISNCSFFYIFPSGKVNYVIYSDAEFNFDSSVSDYSYEIVKGTGKVNPLVTYVANKNDGTSYGVAIAGQVISEIYANSSIGSTEAITLEFGTEKYPYLITGTETNGKMILALSDFTDKLTDTNWASSTETVYFELVNNVYITSSISFNCSWACGISINANNNVIYVVDKNYVEFPRNNCNCQTFSITNGTITGVDSSYNSLQTASTTSVIQISSSMTVASITNCTFNQSGIDIGKRIGNKIYSVDSVLIDSCTFNYSKTGSYYLINFVCNESDSITMTNNMFTMDAEYTLYFSYIKDKVTLNLSNNTWINDVLNLKNNNWESFTTLPLYNARYVDSDGYPKVNEALVQTSTTAFISGAKGLIEGYATYFEINDEGNTYTIQGQSDRSSSTAIITNNVNAWGIII